MIVQRDQRTSEILAAAADLDVADRRAFVAREAAGDRELEREVLSLLAHHESAESFLATPAVIAAVRGSPAAGPARDSAPPRLDAPLGSVPVRIASYAIEGVLGEGGMGVVYLARQENPKRQVALKVIRHGFATPRLLKRFEREADLQGRLHHPGIGQIFEAGAAEIGGVTVPFLAMELVRGLPITNHVEQARSSLRQRLELAAEVCDAVEHAHRQGVLHRDLKPANILVDASSGRPRPKVLDFGIARDAEDTGGSLVTDTGQVVGTLAYMSPEQASGARQEIGARSDVYSLGVVLYELLTQRLPHDVSDVPFAHAARTIAEDEPAPPSRFDPHCAGDLDTILAKALAKDPARRYGSPAELAADLRSTLEDRPIRARPPSTIYRLEKFARRNRALVAGTCAVVLVLVLGIVATTTQAVRAGDEASRASLERDNARAAELQARTSAAEATAALARESQERTRAEREQQNSRSVSEYFQRLIANVVPGDKGPDARLLDLLQHATSELPGSLAAVPEAEIDVRSTLGQALGALGSYPEAERELELAMRIVELETPVDELKRAVLQGHLGRVLTLADRLAEAVPMLAASQESLARILGPTNERAVESLIDLGDAQRRFGRMADAEGSLRRALEVARESTCEDDDHLANAMRMLAVLLSQTARPAEAEPLQREALERIVTRRGEVHTLALSCMTELANTLQRLERLEEAETMQRKVVDVGARVLGERHPDQLTAMNNLASVLYARGSLDEALELRRRVVELSIEVLGPDHDRTWTARMNLALVLTQRGGAEEAEGIYRDVLARQRERFGTGDRRTLATLYNLGMLFVGARRNDEALAAFEELVASADAVLSPDDWQRASFRKVRGICRVRLKQFELAEEDLLAANAELERLFGPDHANTQDSRRLLAQLYAGWGKPESAERWK